MWAIQPGSGAPESANLCKFDRSIPRAAPGTRLGDGDVI